MISFSPRKAMAVEYALRRREYFLDPKTGKFPPEYAHIIGVPFKLFKPGTTEYVEPVETKDVRALPPAQRQVGGLG